MSFLFLACFSLLSIFFLGFLNCFLQVVNLLFEALHVLFVSLALLLHSTLYAG